MEKEEPGEHVRQYRFRDAAQGIAEAVKQARQSRRRPTKMGEMGMFSGMMYCADCGSILYQCRATGFRKDQEYYICSGLLQGHRDFENVQSI